MTKFSPSSLPHTTPGSLENLGTFHFDIWALGKEDSWSLSFSIRMVKKKKNEAPFSHLSQDVLSEFSIFKKFLSHGQG